MDPLDLDALTRVMLERQPRLVRLAYEVVRDLHAAEDLVQEAFARCLVRFAARQSDGVTSWESYLSSTVRNLANSELRRRARHPAHHPAQLLEPSSTVDPHGDEDVALAAIRSEETLALRLQLKRLPELQRAAVTLLDIDGASLSSASELLGHGRTSISNARRLGREKLRRSLSAPRISPVRAGPDIFHVSAPPRPASPGAETPACAEESAA